MKKEGLLLLEFTQAYFNNQCPTIPEDVNFDNFFKIAVHHNLAGVCHCVINQYKELDIPLDIKNKFKEKFLDIVFLNQKQEFVFEDVKGCFKDFSIKYITFKGIELKKLYSVPESRSMGDIDLLVENDNKLKASEALKSLGFNFYESTKYVDSFDKDGVVLEVHTKLTEDKSFDNAFDNASFNGVYGVFDDSYHFAYLIAHAANHLKTTGAGIRLVLDLAVMLKEKSIELDKVFDILEKIELVKFGQVILSVCYKWFGVGKSFNCPTQSIEGYLIDNGVFGSMKSSNSTTVSRLVQIGAIGENKNMSPLALKLKLAFPSYDTMRNASYINFIDGKPWLLPAAWVYRLFYNLKNTPEKMKRNISNIDDENINTLAQRELEFFKEIGL